MVVVRTEQLFRIRSRLTAIMTRLARPFAAVLASFLAVGVTTLSAQITTSLVSPASVVHEYVWAASAIPARGDIPPNLQVSVVHRQLVVKMLSRSPTFRRQMLRIAAATQLTVRLQSAPPSSHPGLRATTEFVRKANGKLLANVDIVWSSNGVELIAHELEHIIEQLDGVDLVGKASRPNSGVYATGDGGDLFETTRAKRVGLQVAREVQ
jgi:hypothetical protein